MGPGLVDGAGGVVATSRDVLSFWDQLMTGEIVSAESLEEMTTPAAPAVAGMSPGLGVMIFADPVTTDPIYLHGGGATGFSALAGYAPAEGLAFVQNFTIFGVDADQEALIDHALAALALLR
jgi:CubicO group peptidase (beta-lactamase class C family)